ncbi:MAG TPA: phosphatase [Gammaproteobacteria bacterium]|nr:phosphatase [Gammaproteobacteria bacterium]
MTHRHTDHAQQVVERFKEMISESGRQHIGQKHFDELTLLIESAISTAVLEELEIAADKMNSLAHQMRNYAEHFDKPPQKTDST